MKNKELIEKLSALDPEAEVITTSGNFELIGANVAINFVHLYTKGSISRKDFIDSFDGESFSREVYSIIGGDLPVILIM